MIDEREKTKEDVMKLYEKLNEQFNFELESGYLYLSMAAYCEEKGLDGFAHFMDQQAKEEYGHARKLYHFLFEMDKKPEYKEIPKPEAEFGTFTELFKAALEHEKLVTKKIKDIYKDAIEEGDLDVQQFLDWFVAEQREEEDTFRGIVERLERINESWNGLYIYDRELGQR